MWGLQYPVTLIVSIPEFLKMMLLPQPTFFPSLLYSRQALINKVVHLVLLGVLRDNELLSRIAMDIIT